MNNNSNKNAFTIAELILTTVIMAVVCVIAPVIILKREVKPKKAPNLTFIAQCTNICMYDAHTAILKTALGSEQRLDYNKNSNAFYTIELVGGGAAGSSTSFGYAGQTKTLMLASIDNNEAITKTGETNINRYGGKLTGYYLLETGNGGTAGDNSAEKGRGKQSKICTINKDIFDGGIKSGTNCKSVTNVFKKSIIIAQAEGGIFSKEQERYSNPQDKIPQLIYENKTYGYGGDKNKNGNRGVITIR